MNDVTPEDRREWPAWALDELRDIVVEWAQADTMTPEYANELVGSAAIVMRALYPGLP